MIKCAVLNKEFETKEEMFAELKANKDTILALKTSVIKNSDSVAIPPSVLKNKTNDGTEKGRRINFKGESGYFYPVINTTNIMDSHKDVHFDGLWDKSKSEQIGKTYYIINHQLEIGKIIAFPADVEILTKEFTFKDLGSKLEGSTQALIYKVKLQEFANKDAVYAIENKLPVENSIRMQYVKVQMGVNSEDEAYKEEKAYYDKHIGKIANKEEVAIDGYFFGVHEAKIYKEGSMVLEGSNSVTPILYASEPDKSTHDEVIDTNQKEVATKQASEFLNEFLNNVKL